MFFSSRFIQEMKNFSVELHIHYLYQLTNHMYFKRRFFFQNFRQSERKLLFLGYQIQNKKILTHKFKNQQTIISINTQESMTKNQIK